MVRRLRATGCAGQQQKGGGVHPASASGRHERRAARCRGDGRDARSRGWIHHQVRRRAAVDVTVRGRMLFVAAGDRDAERPAVSTRM